jgi:hypothetical protein
LPSLAARELMRSDRGPYVPERPIRTAFVLKFVPGQPQRQPGLLANLQAARATIFLMERNDNHSDILGEATCEIKLLSLARAFLSLLDCMFLLPRHRAASLVVSEVRARQANSRL